MRKERALHQLLALEKKPGLGHILKGHRVRAKVHNKGREYRFYLIDDVPPPDDEIPFLISECLFNMRSALDQLAYQLHVRAFRGRVPEKAERASSFPILDAGEIKRRGTADPAKWNEIRRLAQRERTAIKQFQPYISRNDRHKGTRELLNLLALLNNIDKHRRLHVAKAIPAALPQNDRFPAAAGFKQVVYFRPLHTKTEIERWTFDEPPADVEMEHEVFSQVVIDEPTRHLRVFINPAFGEIHHAVEKVLIRFAKLFPDDESYWFRGRPDFLPPRR